MTSRAIWFVGFLALVVGAVLFLNLAIPGSLGTRDTQIQLAYGLILLTVLSSSLAIATRTQLSMVIKYSVIWAGIAMSLIVLYTYQDGFKTLAAEVVTVLDPAQPKIENGTVTLRENSDGHFTASAVVDGARVRFLIDTGASDVVLTQDDARRIGIDVDHLGYTMPVLTANGQAMVAPVHIHKLKLGSIEVTGIDAEVAGSNLDFSLLGMSYLRRLSSYEVTRSKLILKE